MDQSKGVVQDLIDSIGFPSSHGIKRARVVDEQQSPVSRANMPDPTFLHGKGMLVIWGGLSSEAKKSVDEGELNDWWTNEHLPERLSVPGFLRARRYFTFEADSNTSQYLVCYETASLDVLKSEAYLA